MKQFKKEKFNTGTTTKIIISNEIYGRPIVVEATVGVDEEKVSFSGSLDSGTLTLKLKGVSGIQYKYEPSGNSDNYLILNGYSGTGIISPEEKIFQITLKTTGVIDVVKIEGSNELNIRVSSPFKLR